MNRREFVRLAGVGGVSFVSGMAMFGAQTSGGQSNDISRGGPEDQPQWNVSFQDSFDDGFSRDSWGIGWGWGQASSTSSTQIVSENVSVEDGVLHLRGTRDDGQYLSGAVNTKNVVVFGPGSYVEARIRFARRNGFLSAFWMKPNSEAWPPEIDVVELFQSDREHHTRFVSHHNIHYSDTARPGDRTSYEAKEQRYRPGDDLTENFHVYGVEWRDDRIVHTVDGETVAESTDPQMLEAMRRGAPFYLMLSLELGNIGEVDTSESWGESMAIDWVRVWQHRDEADDS